MAHLCLAVAFSAGQSSTMMGKSMVTVSLGMEWRWTNVLFAGPRCEGEARDSHTVFSVLLPNARLARRNFGTQLPTHAIT